MIPDEQTRAFIQAHREEDVRTLALKYAKAPGINLTQALTQIEGWQKAKEKIPTWAKTEGLLYPPHLPMEQCSSELTARYKRQLIEERVQALDTFTDLTGGFGIDFSFLASLFTQATYVERQALLCEIARHNFPLLGLSHAKIQETDAVAYLQEMPHRQWVFIDPARRSQSGGKVVALADCEPNLLEIRELLREKADHVLLKLSPMLDIKKAVEELHDVCEVHVVSVDNECKELLFLLQESIGEEVPKVTAVNLFSNGSTPQRFSFIEAREPSCQYAETLKRYLYEPNASLLKAGAFNAVGNHWAVEKLHPNSHLYTSDCLLEDFPGRIFEVKSHTSFNKKDLKALLHDTQRANLTVRNFPQSVDELRKKLKLREGGTDYLFATTLRDERKVLIRCIRVQRQQ